MDYYIYYRVPSRFEAELRERVEMLQAFLTSQFAVTPLLRRRPDEPQGRQTWMEVYPDIPAALVSQFEAALGEAVERFGLPELIDGPRHLECFMEFSSCV